MTPRKAKQVVKGLNNKDREVSHMQVLGWRGTHVLVRARVETKAPHPFEVSWVVFGVEPNGLTHRVSDAVLKEWKTAQRKSNAAKQRLQARKDAVRQDAEKARQDAAARIRVARFNESLTKAGR